MVIGAAAAAFSEADYPRGGYGPYRANNDLLYYHLDARVDPEKYLSGQEFHPLQNVEGRQPHSTDLVPVMFQIEKIYWTS